MNAQFFQIGGSSQVEVDDQLDSSFAALPWTFFSDSEEASLFIRSFTSYLGIFNYHKIIDQTLQKKHLFTHTRYTSPTGSTPFILQFVVLYVVSITILFHSLVRVSVGECVLSVVAEANIILNINFTAKKQ
jgi:hypothetical protein